MGYQALEDLRKLYGLNHHDVAYQQRGKLIEYKLFYYAPLGAAFDQALDWLQNHAESTDVIAATDPQWVYLRTGRKAVLPPFEPNGKTAQRLIDTVPVKYLVAASNGPYARFTSPLLDANPARWNRIWSSTDGELAVYERTSVP